MDTNEGAWQKQPHRIRIAAGGRVVIPAEVRRALGVREGEELLLTRDAEGFRITSYQDAIRRAHAFFAPLRRDGESVVDELIRERREEAVKEDREFESRTGRKSE